MRIKLVRDRKDEQVTNLHPGQRFFIDDNFEIFLMPKLLEEVGELNQAFQAGRSRAALIDEIADVIEIVYAFGTYRGISREVMMGAVANKRAQLGGFERGLLYQEYDLLPDVEPAL